MAICVMAHFVMVKFHQQQIDNYNLMRIKWGQKHFLEKLNCFEITDPCIGIKPENRGY